MRTGTAQFVHVTEPETIFFAGAEVRILLSGEQTGGAFCLCDYVMPAGNATPPHVHAREDESIHLLAGELECDVTDRNIRLRPGETVLLPRRTRHQLRNAGTQAARALVLCTPSGFESFVAAAGQRASAPTAAEPAPLRPEQLVTLAATFGITILA